MPLLLTYLLAGTFCLPDGRESAGFCEGDRRATREREWRHETMTARRHSGCSNPAAILLTALALSACNESGSDSVPQTPANPPEAGSGNSAPTISGTSPASIKVGENYSFQPSASDPDGDALTFNVEGKPDWANFDSATGVLSGTPQTGDEGPYDNISIVVSDGSASDSLNFDVTVNQFAPGSVTLSWMPPSLNTDGSAITDLAGYEIYYGVAQGNYTEQIHIDNPSVTTYVVDNLSPDTYYFVATSMNTNGVESDFSGVAVRTVN